MERKRGGQQGNQNARTHGFYSKKLDEGQQLEFEQAVSVEGLDEEIALLRVKIKSLVEHDPENVRLITQAINSLTRMVIAQNTNTEEKGGLLSTVGNLLKDVILPISLGSLFKKKFPLD